MKNPVLNVFVECSKIIETKSQAYQNPNSKIKQSDYYPNGLDDILYMIHTKKLRCESVSQLIKNGEDVPHESLRDSLIDLINYAAIGISWMDGEIEGQNQSNDLFNRPKMLASPGVSVITQDRFEGVFE